MEELVFLIVVALVVAIATITLYYKKQQSNLEINLKQTFQDYTIENIKTVESMKTTIEFLTDTKNTLESKIESLTIQSRIELDTLKEELELKAQQTNKKSLALGQNIIKGELIQILSSFYLLTEYDSIALISSVSKHASFDLIGVKKDSLDFIEVKAGNGQLSKNESVIKSLIESNKVHYRVIEGKLPQLDLKIRT